MLQDSSRMLSLLLSLLLLLLLLLLSVVETVNVAVDGTIVLEYSKRLL